MFMLLEILVMLGVLSASEPLPGPTPKPPSDVHIYPN